MPVVETELMTVEQLLAMPEDGMERWLIRGELREKVVTRRNRGHSRVEANIAKLLGNWNDEQVAPRGEVLVGEAGILLKRNPDTWAGVDVAYLSAQLSAANPNDAKFIEGAPTLIAEVLSPSDKHEEVREKIESYLEADVKLVWVVDPSFRTIVVHRADGPPQLFNETPTIDAEPHLPGFQAQVSKIFE